MTVLSSVSALRTPPSQLPVAWYFDPHIYATEQKLLFAQGPQYVGHRLMVPNVGDYHVIEWLGSSLALVHTPAGIQLLSNICRHRQAIILQGRGHTENIICPLHRWTYDLQGKLLGAPHFADNPCLDLASTPLHEWNGLLFTGQRNVARDLAQISSRHALDFSGYVLDHIETDDYACNWKTFIEVYLEDYHVEPFHPGLGQFVNVNDLQWEFGDWHSVQTCGIKNRLARPGSAVYQQWHNQVLTQSTEQPQHGAIWLTYFPNLMVEWYPKVLVVSIILPTGPETCRNVVEFYYPEEIVHFERDFIEAEQAAYRETAVEDAEIIARMTAGRRALWNQGRCETGPYQSPLEDGMRHFHDFLQRTVTPHL